MNGLRIAMLAPHARAFMRGLAVALAPRVDHLDLWVRHNRLVDLAARLPWPAAHGMATKYGASALLGGGDWPANVQPKLASLAYVRRDGRNPGLGGRLGRVWARQLAEGEPPDLLHGQFLHPQGVAAAHASRRLGLPLVLTGHGFDVYDLPYRSGAWEALVRETLAQATAVITVSQRNATILRELGVPTTKLAIIPNGFDPSRFRTLPRSECRERLGMAPDATLIACVGNLERVKGQDILLEAFAQVRRQLAGAQLALVGGGSMRPALEALARRLGVQDGVIFTGTRPHDEIPAWLNAADLMVLPSRDEGNPTILAEAVGCGCRVVATRVGGVPDVLGGALVEPEDPTALAQAMLDALAGPPGPPPTRQDLRWDAVAAATADVYQRAAAR